MTEEKRTPQIGDRKVVTYERREHKCEHCGEPATKALHYTYKNCRSNPKSNAYGRHDDISWVSDDGPYHSCDQHTREVREATMGADMEPAATFNITHPGFEHMRYYWKEIETKEIPADSEKKDAA